MGMELKPEAGPSHSGRRKGVALLLNTLLELPLLDASACTPLSSNPQHPMLARVQRMR